MKKIFREDKILKTPNSCYEKSRALMNDVLY